AAAAVLPDHAAVPVAGPGRHGAAPVPVDHRVLPADPHGRLPARRCGRCGRGRRPERPGPGDDPAETRRPARRTRPGLLTGAASYQANRDPTSRLFIRNGRFGVRFVAICGAVSYEKADLGAGLAGRAGPAPALEGDPGRDA